MPITSRFRWFSAMLVAATLVGVSPAGVPVILPLDLEQMRPDDLVRIAEFVLQSEIRHESLIRADLPALLRLFNRLRETPGNQNVDWTGWQRLLVERSREYDLSTLRKIVAGEKEQRPEAFAIEPLLLQRSIEIEVARVCANPKLKPAFPADAPPIFDELYLHPLNGVGADILRRAVGPISRTLAKIAAGPPRSLFKESKAYATETMAILQGKAKGGADRLLRFKWDGMCGTGSIEFRNQQVALAFLALLREDRISEAVGLSFTIPDSPLWIHEPNRSFDQWRSQLLQFAGIDSEEALLSVSRYNFLAAAGSEKALRQLVEELQTKQNAHPLRAEELYPLLSFLIPLNGDPDGEDPREKIDARAQASALQFLRETLRGDLRFSELLQILDVFAALHRFETRETLRPLLHHPSSTIARRAAEILRRMGDQIPDIPAAASVKFRLLLNGDPWPQAGLYGRLKSNTLSFGASVGISDSHGIIAAPRDVFLDPVNQGDQIQFSATPSPGNSLIGSPSPPDPFADPWVQGEIPRPKTFDGTIDVPITAYPIPVEVDFASPPKPSPEAPVWIKLYDAQKISASDWGYPLIFTEVDKSPPDHFTYRTIAPGEYRLQIIVPGAATYFSPPFEVRANLPPLRVKLEKGCYLYASIFAPQNALLAERWRLYRGAEDVTDQYAVPKFPEYPDGVVPPLFVGLPRGKYRLQVLSSEETRRQLPPSDPSAIRPAHLETSGAVDCEGLAVEFTVDDSTPPRLDLGHLENKPIDSLRAQASPMIQVNRPHSLFDP